jgi:hypothetical protein
MTYRMLFVLFVLCALGCDDLSAFRTGKDKVFRGMIEGSDTGDEDGGAKSFIREGFVASTRLELTFDPDFSLELDSSTNEKRPGTISTFHPKSAQDKVEVQGDFQKTELEVIEPLSRDSLSRYTFPGGGRIRSYIFGVRFCDGARSALVFVSLMEDKDIEVRIIAPSVENVCASSGESNGSLFGVFRLKRESTK